MEILQSCKQLIAGSSSSVLWTSLMLRRCYTLKSILLLTNKLNVFSSNHGKCPGGFHMNVFGKGEGCVGLVSLRLPYREDLLMWEVLLCKQSTIQWWKSSFKKHFDTGYSVGAVRDPPSKEKCQSTAFLCTLEQLHSFFEAKT